MLKKKNRTLTVRKNRKNRGQFVKNTDLTLFVRKKEKSHVNSS